MACAGGLQSQQDAGTVTTASNFKTSRRKSKKILPF